LTYEFNELTLETDSILQRKFMRI